MISRRRKPRESAHRAQAISQALAALQRSPAAPKGTWAALTNSGRWRQYETVQIFANVFKTKTQFWFQLVWVFKKRSSPEMGGPKLTTLCFSGLRPSVEKWLQKHPTPDQRAACEIGKQCFALLPHGGTTHSETLEWLKVCPKNAKIFDKLMIIMSDHNVVLVTHAGFARFIVVLFCKYHWQHVSDW